jgi:hypothetical protein
VEWCERHTAQQKIDRLATAPKELCSTITLWSLPRTGSTVFNRLICVKSNEQHKDGFSLMLFRWRHKKNDQTRSNPFREVSRRKFRRKSEFSHKYERQKHKHTLPPITKTMRSYSILPIFVLSVLSSELLSSVEYPKRCNRVQCTAESSKKRREPICKRKKRIWIAIPLKR